MWSLHFTGIPIFGQEQCRGDKKKINRESGNFNSVLFYFKVPILGRGQGVIDKKWSVDFSI